MPNYRRPRVTNTPIFFTVNLANRASDVLTRHIALLREAVWETSNERPFHIDAWVILPDHMHAVWTLPNHDTDYSCRWGAIKARFSKAIRRAGFTPPLPVGQARGGVNPALRRKGEVGLWQPRFWEHHIRDEADYQSHVEYCWGNPVKHGFVANAADWPFSSIHRDISAGLISVEWSGKNRDGQFGD
ncbi:MAG: transposase [Pseudomonadota bacterium]